MRGLDIFGDEEKKRGSEKEIKKKLSIDFDCL
jgi:hypothetical protein